VANRHRLAGVGWIKTCGGLFAFLSGDAKRAPRWMQRCGLEWFHRLMQEPLRLGSRYLVTNLHAAWILLRS
jgi:exopolysaccharide biosynthesis WecB/TagA/CpsF family protein